MTEIPLTMHDVLVEAEKTLGPGVHDVYDNGLAAQLTNLADELTELTDRCRARRVGTGDRTYLARVLIHTIRERATQLRGDAR